MGCFGWGPKSLCWKSLCAFSASYSRFARPWLVVTSQHFATKTQKNPRAHKNKIGHSPPQTQNTPPPKTRNLWTWLFPAERTHFSRRPYNCRSHFWPQNCGQKLLRTRGFFWKAPFAKNLFWDCSTLLSLHVRGQRSHRALKTTKSSKQRKSTSKKRPLLFLRSDLALQERILKIRHFLLLFFCAISKIRSYSARSDLKNRSARFSWKYLKSD